MEYQDQKQHIELIAMGASTGGTEALLAVLKELPGNLPPIVITQHMPPVFTGMYAERLNRLCAMEVRDFVLLLPEGCKCGFIRIF